VRETLYRDIAVLLIAIAIVLVLGHGTTAATASPQAATGAFVLAMAAGSIVGSFIDGRLLGLVPSPVLLPLLAIISALSAVKVKAWRHK
jgi:cytochrome c biogenesis protein CcdA